MCGIAGWISQQPGAVTHNNLLQMTNALHHRGPDGHGHWINDTRHAGLGHRRLSILDTSSQAAQPMHFHHLHLTYNGEIYNYLEIKQVLQAKGYQFTSTGDTEVLLKAYHAWGKDCLHHFDGMFAFAIWNDQAHTLFAARDRFGEKPFHYTHTHAHFAFASEIKAITPLPFVEVNVNRQQLFQFLATGTLQQPSSPEATFFEDIYSLPPAHYLEFHLPSNRLHQQAWWQISPTPTLSITPAEATARFAELFSTSVQRRLRSDVPIGCSLSGGLDSSAVLATMVAGLNNTDQLNTYSAVFPGFAKNESAWSTLVSHHLGVRNTPVTPDTHDLATHLDQLLFHQEAPFGSASIFTQYAVYAAAQKHGTTVLLDGQGADELMGGYHKYYRRYWHTLYQHDRKTFYHEKNAAQTLHGHSGWNLTDRLAARYPTGTQQALRQRVLLQQRFHPHLHRHFIREQFQSSAIVKPVVNSLNDLLFFDTFAGGLEELLRYADRNAMAHSREVRLPFLYHELVSFIFALPPSYKIRNGWTKWILRNALQHQLPQSITWRTDKIGYESPQQNWLQANSLKPIYQTAVQTLISEKVLHPRMKNKPLSATAGEISSHEWRYLVAGRFIQQLNKYKRREQ